MSNGVIDFASNPYAIELMFGQLVRSDKIFRMAADFVNEDCFLEKELVYRTVWLSVKRYYAEYGHLPEKVVLKTMVAGDLHNIVGATQEHHDDAMDFIEWAFGVDFDSVDNAEAAIIEVLRQFLSQRRVSRQLMGTAEAIRLNAVDNLPSQLMSLYDEASRINSVGSFNQVSAVPDQWFDTAVRRIPTGVTFIDRWMDGGMEPGEVYVLLGPTGVGKTTLSVQSVCSHARILFNTATRGGEQKYAALFFYEDYTEALTKRVLSFAARIPIYRLNEIRGYDDMSTSSSLLPYEIDLFGRHDIPGETERKDEAAVWLNRYLELCDFSGFRGAGGVVRGYGGVSEIKAYLDVITDTKGFPPSFVVIDWAGTCVKRYLQATNQAVEKAYNAELGNFVDRCRAEIAAQFNCSVMIAHQLRGAVNEKPPTFEFHHSHAEGCTSFANMAWYAFVLGTKDRATSTCMIRATKTRRSEDMPPVICHIDGAYSRMVDRSDTYQVDPVTRRIITAREADVVGVSTGMPNIGPNI